MRTEELQNQLWSRAVALGQDAATMPSASVFGQALMKMIDVHLRRVAATMHNSIPSTIWLALYCVLGLAMGITGYRAGIVGRRSMAATAVMVLAFAAIFHLIADLDRPQEGFLTISQQPMLDLQTKLHR
jgi:hypothetical protein